jgi:DNA-binding NarL/FixJ family response regulator
VPPIQEDKMLTIQNTPKIAKARDAETRSNTGPADGSERTNDVETAPTLVIIDSRALSRECLAASVQAAARQAVLTFASVKEWLDVAATQPSVSLVLLCADGRKLGDQTVERQLALLAGAAHPRPVILLSDIDEISEILAALEGGAQGYIPTSITLNLAIEAMRLVRAGGIFVPATSLMAWNKAGGVSAAPPRDLLAEVFTTRQAAVLRALREGKANKVIAYELKMRESTVKVHVRNIMKKLKARNRTEAAFKTDTLLREKHL